MAVRAGYVTRLVVKQKFIPENFTEKEQWTDMGIEKKRRCEDVLNLLPRVNGGFLLLRLKIVGAQIFEEHSASRG
jgi:hypothetical protein